MELSRSPIFVWDFDSGIMQWNRGSEELYGYSRQEAIGKRKEMLLQTSVPGSSFDELRQSLLEHGTWSGQLLHRTKDGRVLTVESQIELVPVGERRLVLESTRDVTDQKRVGATQAVAAQRAQPSCEQYACRGAVDGASDLAHDRRQAATSWSCSRAALTLWRARITCCSRRAGKAPISVISLAASSQPISATIRSGCVFKAVRSRCLPILRRHLGLCFTSLRPMPPNMAPFRSQQGMWFWAGVVGEENGQRLFRVTWQELGGPPVTRAHRRQVLAAH